MTEGSGNTKEISLGDDFGDVLIKVNGATIDVSASGYIVATSPRGVEWRHAATPGDDEAKHTPEIGDEMPDGTIYAGISPDTGKPLYATPQDAPGTYTFNEAAKYAKNLDAHGHHDFHAPSKGELNVLYENRNKGKLKGTFNEAVSFPAGWYWSSSPILNDDGWAQRFSDGRQLSTLLRDRDFYASLRCVRG